MRLLARFFGFSGGVFVLKRMSSMQLLNHYLEKTATNNPCLIVSYLEVSHHLVKPDLFTNIRHPTVRGILKPTTSSESHSGLKQIHGSHQGREQVMLVISMDFVWQQTKNQHGGIHQNMIPPAMIMKIPY